MHTVCAADPNVKVFSGTTTTWIFCIRLEEMYGYASRVRRVSIDAENPKLSLLAACIVRADSQLECAQTKFLTNRFLVSFRRGRR